MAVTIRLRACQVILRLCYVRPILISSLLTLQLNAQDDLWRALEEASVMLGHLDLIEPQIPALRPWICPVDVDDPMGREIACTVLL